MKEMKRIFFRRLQVLIVLLVACCQLTGCTYNSTIATQTVSNSNKKVKVDPWVDTTKFYYNQLNEIEKEIYNAISDSRETIINNGEFFCITGPKAEYETYFNYISRAADAFEYDNPDVKVYFIKCWIVTKCSRNSDGEDYYDFFIKPHPGDNQYSDFSSEELKVMLKNMESTTREFVDTLSGSDADKLKKIHDWLIEDAVYDETCKLPNTNNAYGAIIQKNCVCGGYAYAFKYIADMAGLDVLFVTGDVYNENSEDKEPVFHAWNYAYVDGRWLIIDVTWDISMKSSYPFFNSQRYLLLSPEKERESGMIRTCQNKSFEYPH